jgi:serine/threonine-protein kinase
MGFLESACGDDAELLADVSRLVAADAEESSLLDRGIAEVASDVLAATVPQISTERFGAYRVTGTLGEGGMGIVYLATRDDIGSVAAIKILRDAWISPARRERFASEQRTLAQLNHPSIARLYDADALPDGTPFFVMEYVDGMSLTEYCRSRGSSIAERLGLFRTVCEAVQHAHRHAVIHRDIKPGNILVTADGEVKLLDFGIAKQVESVELPAEHTRTGARLMTPAYAAPEQIRGERVGVHTDVYSLGVTLYELLSGRLPFDLENRTPAEIERVILEHEPVRPSAVARKVAEREGKRATFETATRAQWEDLDVLCLTAMHRDSQRRYPSVDSLIRDLDHFAAREPLEARPDSTFYRLDRFVRRHWRPLTAAALVLLIIGSLTVFYTLRLADARNEAVAEAARARRIQQFALGLFNGGNEDVAPAESLRVVTLLDRGVQTARTLDADPAAQAELYRTLGGIFLQLGDLARADTLVNAALASGRLVRRPDAGERARSLVSFAEVRDAQARYDDAERTAREAIGLLKSGPSHATEDLASATLVLGRILENRGRYDDALPLLEEAIRLREQVGAPEREVAQAMTELANTHFYAGHYAVSDSINKLVLDIDRRAYGDRHAAVANDLINLGAIQFEWGRYDEAERYYRQALSINVAWFGADNPETASNLTLLGRALNFQGRYDEATEVLDSALAIQERVYGPVHPRVASALNDLGSIALAQGRLDSAAADFTRMRDIYRKVYGDKHYLLGVATANLGSVYLARKDYAQAERYFREGARIYSESQGPDHLNTGVARIKLGRALLRQKHAAEALVETSAGYRIVSAQTSPSVSWLQAARKDLIEEFTALGRPDSAARYRAEDSLAVAKPESVGVKIE